MITVDILRIGVCSNMKADDVKRTVDQAIKKSKLTTI
jgi:hypothetical protein